MATIKKLYSDIDFTFTRKPVTNDVALSFDEMAVIRSVRNLLLTNNFERPFNPEIGSNINALLFEPISEQTIPLIRNSIINAVEQYLPEIAIDTIDIVPFTDSNTLVVTIMINFKS
jgi:phage baseplate assembly protein W